jgi:uncharacterized protein
MPTISHSSSRSTGIAPDLRLRAVHPIVDADGSCRLVYDLERTFILDVPPSLQPALAAMLRAGSFADAAVSWLHGEDVLTAAPAVTWADTGARPLPKVTDVSFDLSGSCNLGCVYCFEKDIHSRIGPMSDDTAMAALDFAFARASGAPRVALHFGSGEPLVRIDLLRQVVVEALRRSRDAGTAVTFELTTNATLVTPEIAAFLHDNPFNVRVSCDGPPALHDAYRPFAGGRGSYAAVERGLRLLLDVMPTRVTVNSVLAAGSRLRDLWDWAKRLRLQHYHVIKVGAVAANDINLRQQELEQFRGDLQSICDDLFAMLERGEVPIDYQPITKVVRRLMIPEPITRFCGVAGSYLGVASDGEVYPCFRHLGLPQYHVGSVRAGVDDDKRKRFMMEVAADVDNRPVCQQCWARYLCGGGCYADSSVYGPDARQPQVQHCPFWLTEIELAIRFYKRLLATDPRYCIGLFGDDPDALLSATDGEAEFIKRRNCQ